MQKYLTLLFLLICVPTWAQTKTTREFIKDGQNKSTYTTSEAADGSVTSTNKVTGPIMDAQISVTQTKEEQAKSDQHASVIGAAVVSCKPIKTTWSHPLVPDVTVAEEVVGMVGDKCKYTQSMPNNVLMACLFDDKIRQQIKQKGWFAMQQQIVGDEKTCQITGR